MISESLDIDEPWLLKCAKNRKRRNPTKSENWPPRKSTKKKAPKKKFRAHFQPNQKRQIKLKTFDIKKIHFNSHVTSVTLWRSDRIRFGILTHTYPHSHFQMRQKNTFDTEDKLSRDNNFGCQTWTKETDFGCGQPKTCNLFNRDRVFDRDRHEIRKMIVKGGIH